jgi:hypothetical protein
MKPSETTNLITKNLKEYTVYIIDAYDMKWNGIEVAKKFVIDKKIKLNEYIKIIEETDIYYIFQYSYDGVPRNLKGFKTKEFALKEI